MVDGLPGDVVALALPLDIMKIEEAGLIDPGWQVMLCTVGPVSRAMMVLMLARDALPSFTSSAHLHVWCEQVCGLYSADL